MAFHQQDFPFEEIKRPNGDYFNSVTEAEEAGYNRDQIWSVVHGDENCCTYGPSHHYINVTGYIATNERHDGDTYYEESWEIDDE